VTRASGRCLDVVRVLRITQGAPAVEAVALRCQAVLEALRGRTDAARRMLAASRHMVEELGITQRLLEADVFAGLIELLDGDALAAERLLRGAYDGLRAHGLGIDAAQAAALLGRALLAQDRADEAETLSHDSEALAGDDLKAAIAWRGVRAEALARRGRSVAGIELARAAVELAAATDTLLDHADARLSLAATLRAAGRDSDAAVEEGHAIALWEAKGATLLVQRASGGVRARPVSPAAPLGAAGDRRIRANAATRNAERFDAAIAARDVDALLAGMAEDLVVFEHRNQLDYGRAVVLTMIEDLLWNSTQPRHRLTALASLGESLTLLRREISTGAVDTGDLEVGAADSESLFLSEVDAAGRRRRTEIFAADQLAAAIGRLYEWHAQLTPAGAARARAVAIAGTVAAILLLPGAPAIDGVFAPDVESLDHRLLGFSAGRGAEMQQRVYRDLFALAADLVVSVEDVLALRPDALLLRSTSLGTVRASGGRFERPFIQLRSFDADGRLSRAEFFDTDDEAEALARFDALFDAAPVSAARRAAPLENAATRAGDRLAAAMAVRDWESLVALMPAGFRSIDRSRMVQLEIDRERYLETFRPIFDALSTATFTAQPLATRGDRLTLARLALTGSGETVGPTEIEWLAVLEVDADGQPALEVAFDADALDAATAELDARYAAGEAAVYPHAGLAPAFARAFDARDWQRLASLLAPDVVVHDHRLLGWETLHGPAAYVEALQSLVDLAPDVRLRLDHLAMSADGVLCIPVWVGTRDGGEFETASVFVTALDARGRIRAFDAFDLEQLDAARQRFAALRSPG
jgi:ketosteroid isomerase-like protein